LILGEDGLSWRLEVIVISDLTFPSIRDFRSMRSFVERGFQYPERDHFLMLACSFYMQHISASIACHSTLPVYVIEFSAY